MNPILSFPKIESDKSTAEQLAQMKSYLRQFKSEVELILSNIDADNVTQTFEADMFEGFSKRLAGTDTISQISQTTGLIKLSVKDLEESEASLIVTVNGIKAEVYDGQGNSRITQNANAISSEVTRATNAEGSLSSRITQNADAITLKVSKSSIVSELNSHMSSEINISYDGIEILSDGALVVNTGGFKLDEDGNAEFAGKVTSSSGEIGGFEITSDEIRVDNDIIDPSHGGFKITSRTGAGQYALMIGYTDPSDATSAPFRVNCFGYLHCDKPADFYRIDTDRLTINSYLTDTTSESKLPVWKLASVAVANDDYVLCG